MACNKHELNFVIVDQKVTPLLDFLKLRAL